MRVRGPQAGRLVSPATADWRTAPGSTAPAAALPVPEGLAPAKSPPDLAFAPRLRTADRQQPLTPLLIDDLLEPDHPARQVWRFAEGLDLSVLYNRIRARGSTAGRPPIDPRILVALWLYATLAGVKSANALAELCLRHDAYFWLAGGDPVNAHTLSDFRVQDGDFLERMLAQSVTVLREQGLIDLGRVAQDGMRVRACAGAASFRRRATLVKLLHEAQAEVQRLQQHQDAAPGQEHPEPSPQQRGAQRRHAQERAERLGRALQRMPQMEAKKRKAKKKSRDKGGKKAQNKDEARVSSTDPEATVMKMADGGYRPAYNVQFSTACQGQVIVGVEVVQEGSD